MVCFNTSGLVLANIWSNKILFENFGNQDWKSQFSVNTWNNSFGCCTLNTIPFYNSVDAIDTNDNYLNMHVNPTVYPMISSSISSFRDDILYGSFRISAKFPRVNGSSFGFFFFYSTVQEIDIEVLMHEVIENKVRTAVQPIIRDSEGRASNSSQKLIVTNNSMADSYIEYRFDWFKDQIDYYIDGNYSHSFIVNIPFKAGKIVINHHSNGNPYWSRGPPLVDSVIKIKYIEMYFNSSIDNTCSNENINVPPYNVPKSESSTYSEPWKKYILAIIISSVIVGIFVISGIVYGISRLSSKKTQMPEPNIPMMQRNALEYNLSEPILEPRPVLQRNVIMGTRRA